MIETATPFSTAVHDFLKASRTMPLGPGATDRAAAERLRTRDLDGLFTPATIRDRTMARACQAGLWLWLNDLDESHRISQEIHVAEGSFWHGIMHRREGDFDNAKYWFHRVRQHPVYWSLAETAKGLARGVADAPTWLTRGPWDSDAFVDLCAACVEGRSSLTETCVALQRREWELLFDHCYRRAIAMRDPLSMKGD